MRGIRTILVLIILLLLLPGCESEVKLITGTVTGKVVSYSQYNKTLPAQEEVTVNLYRDTVVLGSALSDVQGKFYLNDVPYGKYFLMAFREKFVPSWSANTIYHVGGPAPSMQDVYVYEVPTSQVNVDSLGYSSRDGLSNILFWISADTVVPTGTFRVFADSVNSVTSSKFTSAGKGYFYNYYPSYPTVVPTYGRLSIYDFDSGIQKLKYDTIFLRLYPNAYGQGYGVMDFYPEALGKPSNLVRFHWNDLIQK
jgi:hypothetical protein